MRFRILVVSPRLDVGGTEIHLSRVLPELHRIGFELVVFPLRRGGHLEEHLTSAGVQVIGDDLNGRRAVRSVQVIIALRRAIDRSAPDIVHFFLAEPYLVGALASFGLPRLVRIMSRRSLSTYQSRHPVLARIERGLHRRMDALIANSTAVATELANECRDTKKIGIIANGVELGAPKSAAACREVRSELGVTADAFVMVTVANLFAYKGHADILHGLHEIRPRLKEDWRLMVVGRDAGAGPDLRRLAESLGISKNIMWLGERLDANRLLDAADIGILASHEEGMSNSLLEKMAKGMPVVATRVGGNVDVVVHGENGFLVAPADPAALGDAIIALHDSVELRTRMAAAARLRIERYFSLKVCVERYARLYRGLVPGGGLPVAELLEPAVEPCEELASQLG
jgi:glycosyltransferase involved in cell wall biosynthesis